MAMQPEVGIFSERAAAESAAKRLRQAGIPPDRIKLLLPGHPETIGRIPTSDTEGAGTGPAIGAVVGGAAGATGGMILGPAVAALLIPGVGPVTAVGLAAAALLGAAGGAAAGGAAGAAMEQKLSDGLPKDESYLYAEALAKGRTVVFVAAETSEEAERAREVFRASGAESIDAARKTAGVGAAPAEEARYDPGELGSEKH
jgi:hypothetical protein